MPGRSLVATLTANVGGYVAGMARAAAATQQFAAKSSAAVSKNEAGLNKLSSGAGLVGAGLAVGLGVAVKSAADFDSAMSSVAATGSNAKANLDALRQAAISAGADTKYSATEAAGGIEALAKAGVSAQDTLGGGLSGALNLAAAGNLDVAGSAEAAATAMTQFGLAGDKVPHIADLLAAGAGKAQGEVSDLAAALNQSGLVASGFGLSIEDTTGTLAAFASAGLLGSDAGTSFKTMLQRLANPSGEAASLMDKLGIAAYDAQGNFVGISAVAEQLKDKLGPLSQAQRDAALSTIFGSDAIRAANVLYTQGATGIDSWISQVNDSGYAAEVARTKMDNLKGDLETLRGSFETALIGLGEGANSPFRSLVQGATNAVNAFNDLGSSTKGTILAVGGIGAAGLLGVAGVLRLVVGVNSARAAFSDLSESSPRLAGALGAVSKAAGVATAALVALQVVGAVQRQFEDNFNPTVEAASAALLSFAGSPDANLDDKFKFETGVLIKDQVDGLGSAFQRLNQSGFADTFAEKVDSLSGTTDSVTGQIKTQFESLDQSLIGLSNSGSAEAAAQSFRKIADAAALQGTPVERLVELFPEYAASARSAAEANEFTITSTQQLVDIMGGKLPAGFSAAGSSADGAGSAFDSASAALSAIGQNAGSAAGSIDELTASLFANQNAALAVSNAQIGFEQAVDAAAEAAKKNGENLKLSSEAGRENQSALNNLAASSARYVESLVQQGKSAKTVAGATADARSAFVDTATAMGMSGRAARQLADQYGLVPKDVKTKIEAQTGQAKSELKQVNAAIKGLPKEQQTEIRTAYKEGGLEAAKAKLAELKDKKVEAKIDSDLTGADNVDRRIKGLKGKTVTAGTKADLRGQQATQKAVNSTKGKTVTTGTKADIRGQRTTQAAVNSTQGKTVTVGTRADTSGARAAQAAVNSVQNRTVTITVRKVGTRIGLADAEGGLATYGGTLYRSNGGPVWGAGTATSDSIDAKLSNGEYVQKTAAVNYYGVAFMQALNNMRVPKDDLPQFSQGGPVGLATGGQVRKSTDTDIRRLIATITNPVGAIVASLNRVLAAQKALAVENRKIAKPKAALNQAARKNERLVDRRQDQREEVARLKKRADATKGNTAADRAYKKATAELRDINNAVTRSSTAKRKAQEAYNKVAGKSKAASDKLKEAQRALAEQQKALADSARQVSDEFTGQYRTTSTDARDWIDLMKTGATDITAFTAKIAALRKAGLSETLVQQIIGMGAVAGSEIASQIAGGGKALVDSLNKANGALQTAADKLGYVDATGKTRMATGGPVTGPGSGTSDSVPIWASNGEWVVPEHAVPANRAYLEAITYGRNVVAPANHARNHYAGGGQVNTRPALIDSAVIAHAVQAGMEGMTLHATLDGKPIQAMITGSNRQLGRTLARTVR